jgi:hypothetical protein
MVVVSLVINIFLLPTLYVWVASDRDLLPAADPEFDDSEEVE